MKFKVEDIQGRHVVLAGILIYILCLIVGIGSTGISLDGTFTIEEASLHKASEMVVPVSYLKTIFLNNLGLNAIIILGAFSLLAFSMIVLIFNALHVGLLLKGIYTSYGLRLAVSLIMPHLIVEVVSHVLSLYIAFLILQKVIVPVVIRGEGVEIHSIRIAEILILSFLVGLITFFAALVEIFVTPKLI